MSHERESMERQDIEKLSPQSRDSFRLHVSVAKQSPAGAHGFLRIGDKDNQYHYSEKSKSAKKQTRQKLTTCKTQSYKPDKNAFLGERRLENRRRSRKPKIDTSPCQATSCVMVLRRGDARYGRCWEALSSWFWVFISP